MSEMLATQLIEQLHSLSFHAFEGCLCDLLSAMGYEEVTLLGRTQTRQFTSHGGRDLEAYACTGVTHARLVLQAKQYRRPVSRRFVDELRGTVLRLGARQGLLITTSTFSKVAHRAAGTVVAPVQLLDGEALVRLMIHHRIGVATPSRPDSQEMRLNTDYFTRLQERFPDKPPCQEAPESVSAPIASQVPAVLPSTTVAVLAISLPHQPKGGTLLWRTHVFASVSTLWLFKLIPDVLTPETFPALALLAAFGALLPDLDASESKIRSLSVGGIRPFAPVSVVAHRTFGHRGFLHSLQALALLALALTPVALKWNAAPPLALWMGYASHLLLDACTLSGIPLRVPSSRRFHLLPVGFRLRTGSDLEELVLTVFVFLTLWLTLSLLPALRFP